MLGRVLSLLVIEHRGTERLPGRKGKLDRTHYYSTPVLYLKKVVGEKLGSKTLPAYILSGDCPIASSEIAHESLMPEYITEMIQDWLFGECSASGRNRASLLGVMDVLIRFGGTLTGQAKVAAENLPLRKQVSIVNFSFGRGDHYDIRSWGTGL